MSQRDTMKPLRNAIHTMLNGFVTYNGTVIQFGDMKTHSGQAATIYGIYGTQRETDTTETDCTWECKSSIEIMLVNTTGSETSKNPLDEISDIIYDLLLNLPGSNNLPAQSGFQIAYLKRESAVHGPLQISPTETIVSKLIILTAKIIQQN